MKLKKVRLYQDFFDKLCEIVGFDPRLDVCTCVHTPVNNLVANNVARHVQNFIKIK